LPSAPEQNGKIVDANAANGGQPKLGEINSHDAIYLQRRLGGKKSRKFDLFRLNLRKFTFQMLNEHFDGLRLGQT
jgi:hypothetical protein